MKKHLIKFIGSAEMDYHTTTYCNLHSDEWSEKFADNLEISLTDNSNETTCKRCTRAFNKALNDN